VVRRKKKGFRLERTLALAKGLEGKNGVALWSEGVTRAGDSKDDEGGQCEKGTEGRCTEDHLTSKKVVSTGRAV
jgi:hypothetical protein